MNKIFFSHELIWNDLFQQVSPDAYHPNTISEVNWADGKHIVVPRTTRLLHGNIAKGKEKKKKIEVRIGPLAITE